MKYYSLVYTSLLFLHKNSYYLTKTNRVKIKILNNSLTYLKISDNSRLFED